MERLDSEPAKDDNQFAGLDPQHWRPTCSRSVCKMPTKN
jgi:hypothetical protein